MKVEKVVSGGVLALASNPQPSRQRFTSVGSNDRNQHLQTNDRQRTSQIHVQAWRTIKYEPNMISINVIFVCPRENGS